MRSLTHTRMKPYLCPLPKFGRKQTRLIFGSGFRPRNLMFNVIVLPKQFIYRSFYLLPTNLSARDGPTDTADAYTAACTGGSVLAACDRTDMGE